MNTSALASTDERDDFAKSETTDFAIIIGDLSEFIESLRSTGRFDESQLQLVSRQLLDSTGNRLTPQFFNPLPVGSQIASFRIEGLVSEGGGGRVYRARDTNNDRMVAIKVLKSLKMSRRFQREMQLVQRLAHPNIVVAYEVGEYKQIPYIVMELLDGPDLSTYIKNHGKVAWELSLEWIIKSAFALDYANQRGLIHRDVSPGNLVLHKGNELKVADLGLAAFALAESDVDFTQITNMGGLVGTLPFMAPEQARSLANADARSDIYGLGATWFYLISGAYIIRGKSLSEMIVALLGHSVRGYQDIVLPDPVRMVLDRMTAFDPKDRYQSWREVLTALTGLALEGKVPNVHILVVEDDRGDMLLTTRMLGQMNRAVTTTEANSLAESIRHLVSKVQFDLILLDLELTDSFGVATVESVRRIASRTPVIVVSGNEDPQVARDCLAAGANGFTAKSELNMEKLEQLVFVTLSFSDQGLKNPIAP